MEWLKARPAAVFLAAVLLYAAEIWTQSVGTATLALLSARKLHADDTPVVLAPGTGKTKTGRFGLHTRLMAKASIRNAIYGTSTARRWRRQVAGRAIVADIGPQPP